ncbi:MAG: helix-turn-helix domain-containing protein [Chitinispirillales bacterium]|jgi:transcriptional regulator with XRE-family HTH domain|nr:helix-turn-helix domain-containing protein [Chitinispirillales bacterium]
MTKSNENLLLKQRIAKIVRTVEGSDSKAKGRFGAKIGRDGKLVAEWCNPKRKGYKPTLTDIQKIAAVYNVNVEYLQNGIGSPLAEGNYESPEIVPESVADVKKIAPESVHIDYSGLVLDRAEQALNELKARGNSNAKLADMIGVTEDIIKDWLRRERNPDVLQIQKIARISGRNISWFFGDTTEAPPSNIFLSADIAYRLGQLEGRIVGVEKELSRSITEIKNILENKNFNLPPASSDIE